MFTAHGDSSNCHSNSGVTPIGQGWTKYQGPRGLGTPKSDPICVYFNISSVGCQPSIAHYS